MTMRSLLVSITFAVASIAMTCVAPAFGETSPMLDPVLPTDAGQGLRADEDPTLRLSRGNDLYRNGDFAGAAAAYGSLVEEGVHHETVYYNLGCALARQGRLGEALLSFRRAELFSPWDDDIAANLAWVRARLSDERSAAISPEAFFHKAAALIPERAALILLLVFEYAAALLFIAAFVRMRKKLAARALTGTGVVLLLLGFLAGASGLTADRLKSRHSGGVVIAERTDARSGPAESNPALFTIHEGFEVEIRDARDGWVRISAPGGLAGWIPCEGIRPVSPNRDLCPRS